MIAEKPENVLIRVADFNALSREIQLAELLREVLFTEPIEKELADRIRKVLDIPCE